MRIIAGAWRGRTLFAPPGQGTRPTADRVRQALFDMLLHAPWGGRSVIEGAVVLDVFAGTGALGLEALSRGAASACFIENDAAALKALRANIKACGVEDRTRVLAGDVLGMMPFGSGLPGGRAVGESRPATLVFLDPPYGQDLVPHALKQLREAGHVDPGALVVAETGRAETWTPKETALADRHLGAARITIFRAT